MYTKLVTKVVTIPIPFKDSYYDGPSHNRKQIDGLETIILSQIENDSTDSRNNLYAAEQYWRERDRLYGDASIDRTSGHYQLNSSVLFDLSSVYIPKPNENVLKITFKFNQIFLNNLSTDPIASKTINSPIGATSIFSIFDKYTTVPIVNIISGNKGNFEDELYKAYPRLSKMANFNPFNPIKTDKLYLNNFVLDNSTVPSRRSLSSSP